MKEWVIDTPIIDLSADDPQPDPGPQPAAPTRRSRPRVQPWQGIVISAALLWLIGIALVPATVTPDLVTPARLLLSAVVAVETILGVLLALWKRQ